MCWVKAHLPGNRFGLFVDGVSIFEFFAGTHQASSESLGNFYNAQKNGFITMHEATVATSMQNLFPTLFGKSSSDGMDDSQYLPGITNPDKWDYGGMSGLRHQIARELSVVDTQLGEHISSALSGLSEPSGLARECLYRAKRFVLDLCNFMTNDYQFWKAKGYTKLEAWALTCHSVY